MRHSMQPRSTTSAFICGDLDRFRVAFGVDLLSWLKRFEEYNIIYALVVDGKRKL